MLMLRIVAILTVVLTTGVSAEADTISAVNGNSLFVNLDYYGRRVTTGSSGPWNNIQFAFDKTGGSGFGAYAEGDLFLLTSAYTGNPAGLSSSTAGFVAQSNGVSGGFWTFASTVVPQANTTYYFYMGDRTSSAPTVIAGGPASGGTWTDGSYPYFALSNASAGLDYRLTGSAVPEPTTALLLTLGLAGLGMRRRVR